MDFRVISAARASLHALVAIAFTSTQLVPDAHSIYKSGIGVNQEAIVLEGLWFLLGVLIHIRRNNWRSSLNACRRIQVQDLKILNSVPSTSSSKDELRRWGYQRLSLLFREDCSVAMKSKELVLAIGWICSSCDAFGNFLL